MVNFYFKGHHEHVSDLEAFSYWYGGSFHLSVHRKGVDSVTEFLFMHGTSSHPYRRLQYRDFGLFLAEQRQYACPMPHLNYLGLDIGNTCEPYPLSSAKIVLQKSCTVIGGISIASHHLLDFKLGTCMAQTEELRQRGTASSF